MVIALRHEELWICSVDPLPDHARLAKIEGRSGNISHLSGRDQRAVNRNKLIGV
jgi:hypothetical protein